jgi:hypothetical protein
MGYELRAVIAPTATADTVARDWGPGTGTVPLAQGFALVPYTAKAYDHLRQQHAQRVNPFDWLDVSVADLLAQASSTAALAYVEADFFGGVGTQHAAVWEAGTLAWGPVSLAEQQPIPPQGTAISQAIRRIGLTGTDDKHDAFDVLSLRRHRHLEDWLPDLADNDTS